MFSSEKIGSWESKMDIWSDFFCLGCLVCTIPHLSKSVRTTRLQSGASGRPRRQADIEEAEIGGFDAVWSCSEAFLCSQRIPMTPGTIQCTMIHSGKGQGTSKVHLDRLQKAQENMREASAWFPTVQWHRNHCQPQYGSDCISQVLLPSMDENMC